MSKKDDVLHSLTTRLPAREFLAVQILAKKNNMTESAWVRDVLCNTVDIHTTEVPEEDIERLKSATVRHRKVKKQSWLRKIFG